MKNGKSIFIVLALALCLVCFVARSGEKYPTRPINLIIPFDPATASDEIGRLIARLAEPHLGGKFQIINKPGGAGALGFSEIHNARPDGYTIGIGTTNLAVQKMSGHLPFDHNDVETVIIFHIGPSLFAVSATSNFHNLEDFINEAKNRPGQLTLATGTPGSVLYTVARDFMNQVGIDVKIVPCAGGGAQPAILAGGGHVDACFASPIEARSQLDAGNLRSIAVYLDKKLDNMPTVPSFPDLGLTATVFGFRGIITPKGVDREILEILHDAFKKAMEEPTYKEYVNKSATSIIYAGLDDSKVMYDQQKEAFAAAER